MYLRCSELMRPVLCGGAMGPYARGCLARRQVDYAAIDSEDGRIEWLIAHGCPPSMVNPRAYMANGGSGGTRAEPSPPTCTLPVRTVQVCRSRHGYRFAVPSPAECPTGSTAAGIVQVNCDSVNNPAYHACIDDTGNWTPVVSWETCETHGLYNTTGDFVPPGRAPGDGVGPDHDHPAAPMTTGRATSTATRMLRCYTPTGTVVPVQNHTSCAEVGLADSRPP